MTLQRTLWTLGVLAGGAISGPAVAQHYGGNVVHCESVDYHDNYCPANTRGGVQLVRQSSHAPCYEGESWGYDRRGIWVSNGCAGDFAIGGHTQRYDDHGGRYGDDYVEHDRHGGYGRGQHVVCESRDYRYNYCPVRTRRDVDLVVQYSKSPCRHGTSWGWDHGGIWVDQGCSAEFVVY